MVPELNQLYNAGLNDCALETIMLQILGNQYPLCQKESLPNPDQRELNLGWKCSERCVGRNVSVCYRWDSRTIVQSYKFIEVPKINFSKFFIYF